MEACNFEESNAVLSKPDCMTHEECTPLCVYQGVESTQNMPVIISCWKITKEELEILQKTGRIWLHVLGTAMPPLALDLRHPFE